MANGPIWRCPTCLKGVRAPGHLRKLDVRRWCLPCSSMTGYLTERVSSASKAGRELAAAMRRKPALITPRYADPSQLIAKLRASNGLTQISEPEEEAPMTCARCTRGHGGLAEPCGDPECECFCNRSTTSPPGITSPNLSRDSA